MQSIEAQRNGEFDKVMCHELLVTVLAALGWVIIFAGCGGDDLIPSEQDTPKIPIISVKEIRVNEWWYPAWQEITLYFSLEASEPLPYPIAVDVLIYGTGVRTGSVLVGDTIIGRYGEEVEFKVIKPTWWWKSDAQVKEWRFYRPDYRVPASVKTVTVQILSWDKNRTYDHDWLILQGPTYWKMKNNPYEVGTPWLRTWNSPSQAKFEEVFK